MAGASVSQLDIHAFLEPFFHLAYVGAFMIRLYAGGNVGVKRRSAEARAVAVDDFVQIQGNLELAQDIFIRSQNPGYIHEFAKSGNVAVSHGPLHVKCI